MSPCTILLGGSYDPVHTGHVALARLFYEGLAPATLRLLPAGQPWQKARLQASDAQRVHMLELAFRDAALPYVLDMQEIERRSITYTVDTLAAMRAELGPEACLVFVIGADQLQQLDTWRDWRRLFDYAHIVVGARPGWNGPLPAAVAEECSRRTASLAQLRAAPAGLTYFAPALAVDVSATALRSALRDGVKTHTFLAPVVLDYIQQQHLYSDELT